MGKKIKDLTLVSQTGGDYKIPVSDLTSNAAQAVSIEQIGNHVNTQLGVPAVKETVNEHTDTLSDHTTELAQIALNVSELDSNQEQLISDDKAVPDYSALPLLCGQPPILYGAGTPQESVVPVNWNQFDPETGEGYNWNGEPSALGQVYINTTVTSGGRYTAIPSGVDGVELKWVNF